MASSRSDLEAVLDRARNVGFLGPGPIGPQIDHALGFSEALFDGWNVAEPLVADLGAGGGLPSLPLLVTEPSLRMVLVDASRKRTSFLVWAALELNVADRTEVWCGRAETFAHEPSRRGAFDAVIARGFGPPASTVECAAPLLRVGGRLVVSEPPDERAWPEAPLEEIGLSQLETEGSFATFVARSSSPDRFPRSAKQQQRTPLF